jgi:hypothetical protein
VRRRGLLLVAMVEGEDGRGRDRTATARRVRSGGNSRDRYAVSRDRVRE